MTVSRAPSTPESLPKKGWRKNSILWTPNARPAKPSSRVKSTPDGSPCEISTTMVAFRAARWSALR